MLFLEEAELDYRLIRVDLGKGGQFRPESSRISSNNKVPAIANHSSAGGGEPLSLFESGVILLYLAEKTGFFLSRETREYAAILQQLSWQVGGLGPMLEQNHYLNHIAPQTILYVIERYQAETQRLHHVLNKRLENLPQLGGEDYSITDIVCWPWVNVWIRQRTDLAMHPVVKDWHERVRPCLATGRTPLKAQLGDEHSDSQQKQVLVYYLALSKITESL